MVVQLLQIPPHVPQDVMDSQLLEAHEHWLMDWESLAQGTRMDCQILWGPVTPLLEWLMMEPDSIRAEIVSCIPNILPYPERSLTVGAHDQRGRCAIL